MRAAKSKSAAGNESEFRRRRVMARKNPRTHALGRAPVKTAKALRKK